MKVLDFGIVKARPQTAETGPALTRERRVHGTPAFIAPEQALGWTDAGRPRRHLCHRLRGVLAADRATRVHGRDADGAAPAPRPYAADSAVGPRTNCRFPPRSTSSCCRAWQRIPAERPQTARELSRRLAAIKGAGAWTEERARDWWTNHQPTAS